MDSISLSTLRLTFITLLFAPMAIKQGVVEFRTLTRREWFLVVIAGVLLAFHFIAFLSSLEYTSVINTQVFNGISPLFAAAAGWFILREKVTRPVMIGIGLALMGTVLLNINADAGNPPTRSAPLLGNGLATIGAFLIALYFLIGRSVRGKMSWLPYSWLVFGIAAATMWVLKPFIGIQILGFSREAYLWTIAVTLLAQMITHSSFNFAVGQISPTLVSMSTMVIPIGATVVALFVLDEVPTPLSLVGGVIILIGVALANLRGKKRKSGYNDGEFSAKLVF
jgi:drug/metabolite transporter (DMT)-like permease